jgi:heme-degrading monooxygenase HmoA
MISRIWHGWTKPENADAYENLLRKEILPGIHRVKGFKGAQVLRREQPDGQQSDAKNRGEVEFAVITLFDSLEAVKQFAGEDCEVAVIEPAARKLLSRFDARSAHYQIVFRIE